MDSNRSTQTNATIYSLPSEILIGIFSLVVFGQHCLIQSCCSLPFLELEPKRKDAQGPDVLSHVCSLWRRIVLGFPFLWSHIDIALNHPLNPGLVTRAKVFAARASHIPLEVHIFDPDFDHEDEMRRFVLGRQGRPLPATSRLTPPNALHDFRFSPFNTLRIRSLDFNFILRKGLRSYHMSALEYFLRSCTPGILSHYSMRIHVDTLSTFIEPSDDPHADDSVLLDIKSHLFEGIWLGTTSLHLNNLCPHWGSKAYHGLVELRIGEKVPMIIEAQLVAILRSSPGLRVLHIRTVITDQSAPSDLVVPVRLEDIEDLDLNDRSELDSTAGGEILRWITPGSKPLQLTLNGYPSEGAILFCARANITRLFGESFAQNSVVDMIRRSPRLDILALNAGCYEVSDLYSILGPVDGDNSIGVMPATKVDTLYLVNFSVVPLENLQSAVTEYSVQRLIVRNCNISHETSEGVKVAKDPHQIRMLLPTLGKRLTTEYLDTRCPLDLEGW